MRKLVVVAFGLAVPLLAATAPAMREATVVVVCHRTASLERPYARLTVPSRRLRAHREHAADVIPAPRSCPKTLLTPFHGGLPLGAALSGGATADPVATGLASIRVRRGQGQICAVVAVDDLSYTPTVGVHLHRVGGDTPGATVAIFRGLGLNDGSSSSCARVPRTVVSQILRTPSAFEVDVHTPDFQSGAVGGRLESPVRPPARALGTQLTGAAVCTPVCGTGDPDGLGFALVRVTPPISAGSVCFRLDLWPTVALPALSAHIHRGVAGQQGSAVVELTPPVDRRSMGCRTVHQNTHHEIVTDPSAFYVDVHNVEFPAGAVRGQLPSTR